MATRKSKKPPNNQHYFVRCGSTDKFFFCMHPYIYFECPHCKGHGGCRVAMRKMEFRGHVVWKAQWRSRNQKEWGEKFEKMVDDISTVGSSDVVESFTEDFSIDDFVD